MTVCRRSIPARSNPKVSTSTFSPSTNRGRFSTAWGKISSSTPAKCRAPRSSAGSPRAATRWLHYRYFLPVSSAMVSSPSTAKQSRRRRTWRAFIATSLFKAMNEAKELALAKMGNVGTLRYMLQGMMAELDEIDATFAGDPWPYGVEANRPTLEALVRYMAEQSLIKAPIPVEELFVPIYGQ